jgi:hypothetical protein
MYLKTNKQRKHEYTKETIFLESGEPVERRRGTKGNGR